MKYDKIIIVAGLYGLYAAKKSIEKGEKVLVIEKDQAPFMRATYINQARVHMGYHYPRSLTTAMKSAGYFKRFLDDYSFCIHTSFDQIYATSAEFSWTGAAEFEAFCKAAGIKCEVVKMNKLHLSMPEYVKLYSEPDLVIGMRGHAQMIPFGCGTPIISLVSHDKLQWFLDDIGHQEYGIEIHDPKLGAKLYKKATDILNNSNKFASELDVAKNKLFDITKAELLNILQQIQGYQQHV